MVKEIKLLPDNSNVRYFGWFVELYSSTIYECEIENNAICFYYPTKEIAKYFKDICDKRFILTANQITYNRDLDAFRIVVLCEPGEPYIPRGKPIDKNPILD